MGIQEDRGCAARAPWQRSAFRLCDNYDLIAGTSTGAIIATALAKGWAIRGDPQKYLELGERVFQKSLLRNGLRARYDDDKLIAELKDVYGARTTLGSKELRTGLLVMTSAWTPAAPGQSATTRAASTYATGWHHRQRRLSAGGGARLHGAGCFDPQNITIVDKAGHEPVVGEFVDGGASVQQRRCRLMYATLDGYRIGWPPVPTSC